TGGAAGGAGPGGGAGDAAIFRAPAWREKDGAVCRQREWRGVSRGRVFAAGQRLDGGGGAAGGGPGVSAGTIQFCRRAADGTLLFLVRSPAGGMVGAGAL